MTDLMLVITYLISTACCKANRLVQISNFNQVGGENFSSCMRSPSNSLTWWNSTLFACNGFLMNAYKYVTVFSFNNSTVTAVL